MPIYPSIIEFARMSATGRSHHQYSGHRHASMVLHHDDHFKYEIMQDADAIVADCGHDCSPPARPMVARSRG
jgi:hypothetical protein